MTVRRCALARTRGTLGTERYTGRLAARRWRRAADAAARPAAAAGNSRRPSGAGAAPAADLEYGRAQALLRRAGGRRRAGLQQAQQRLAEGAQEVCVVGALGRLQAVAHLRDGRQALRRRCAGGRRTILICTSDTRPGRCCRPVQEGSVAPTATGGSTAGARHHVLAQAWLPHAAALYGLLYACSSPMVKTSLPQTSTLLQADNQPSTWRTCIIGPQPRGVGIKVSRL